MPRLFLGVRPLAAEREKLKGLMASVRPRLPGVRWIVEANWHLTLLFLGNISPENARAGIQAVASDFPPAHFQTLSHWIWFPTRERARVFGVGKFPATESLSYLHRLLFESYLARGVGLENRSYFPHLTLARSRFPMAAPDLPLFSAVAFSIHSVTLFSSTPGRAHSEYTVIDEYPLRTG